MEIHHHHEGEIMVTSAKKPGHKAHADSVFVPEEDNKLPRSNFTMVYHCVEKALLSLNPSAERIYRVLKNRTRPDNRRVKMRMDSIAKASNISASTIRRHLPALEQLGLIKRYERFVPLSCKSEADEDRYDESKVQFYRSKSHSHQISNLYVVRYTMEEARDALVREAMGDLGFLLPETRAEEDHMHDNTGDQVGQGQPDQGHLDLPGAPSEPPANLTARQVEPPATMTPADPQSKRLANLSKRDISKGGSHAPASAHPYTPAREDVPRPENPYEPHEPWRMSAEAIQSQAQRFASKPNQAKCPQHEGAGWVETPCRDCQSVRNRAKYLEERARRADADERAARRAEIAHCSLCNERGQHETRHRDRPIVLTCSHDRADMAARLDNARAEMNHKIDLVEPRQPYSTPEGRRAAREKAGLGRRGVKANG